MKKTVLSILAVILLCLMPFTAFADTEPQEFTDAETNVKFTMPAGWTRVQQAETDGMTYAFQKDDDENLFLGYSVRDVYENGGDEFKSKYSRSDIDNSIITKEQLERSVVGDASQTGVSDVKAENVTVGEYDFYKLTFKQDMSGTNLNIVVYAHIFNGYAVYFRFQSYAEPPTDEVMLPVMESVVFVGETKSNKTQTDTGKLAKNIGKGALTGAMKGAIIGGAAAIIGLIVGVIRKKARK